LFEEDSNGAKDIQVSLKLTNLSTFKIMATISFGKKTNELSTANILRTVSSSQVKIDANGGSSEIVIIYRVKNANLPVNTADLMDMSITFEKYLANSISVINANGGMVTMGKQSEQSTDEDVEWLCFAYSTDGTTWTKLDSGESIPANAKYGYFVLDTYVSSLDNKDFLARDKYDKKSNSIDNNYYINAGVNGVTTAYTVYANDYYYSDIRQTLKGLETTLSISEDSEIYKAIQGRTITDLYKGINSDGTQLSLPTGANANETDTFWLLSRDELNSLLSKIAWGDYSFYTLQNLIDNEISTYAADPIMESSYWLRSPSSDNSYSNYYVDFTGRVGTAGGANGVRAAFMLKLA